MQGEGSAAGTWSPPRSFGPYIQKATPNLTFSCGAFAILG